MRKCVDCGQEAEDNLDFCLNCGANLPKIIIEPKSPPSTNPSIQGPIATYTLDRSSATVPSFKPQPISSSPVPIPKNQITGRYEQNKFVLLLAIFSFVSPFILLRLSPNANVQSSQLFDQIIAWGAMLGYVIGFILLAAYGGFIFTLKK